MYLCHPVTIQKQKITDHKGNKSQYDKKEANGRRKTRYSVEEKEEREIKDTEESET